MTAGTRSPGFSSPCHSSTDCPSSPALTSVLTYDVRCPPPLCYSVCWGVAQLAHHNSKSLAY